MFFVGNDKLENYSQLIALYYVVEFMSFTKAAKFLDCSKAHISKQIASLERQVGSSLFNRSSRQINLTTSGEAIYKHAQHIINELQHVDNTIHNLQQKAEGTICITTPQGYADYVLAPNLHYFIKQYPAITLEMKHTSEYLDLLKEKIDIAIRITHEPPLDKIAKQLGYDRTVLCASTSYLKQYGQPKTPQELQDHWCLAYNSKNHEKRWKFLIKNETTHVSVKTKLSSNSPKLILTAALDGLGIARLPAFILNEYFNRGELHPVLSGFNVQDIPIYAVYNQNRIIPPKIHAFIQFLVEIHKNHIF